MQKDQTPQGQHTALVKGRRFSQKAFMGFGGEQPAQSACAAVGRESGLIGPGQGMTRSGGLRLRQRISEVAVEEQG